MSWVMMKSFMRVTLRSAMSPRICLRAPIWRTCLRCLSGVEFGPLGSVSDAENQRSLGGVLTVLSRKRNVEECVIDSATASKHERE